jgi:conjugative relaxase-like TrwC/TraI family protein
VLSIQPLKSAEGAASYYITQVDYYASDATAMQWFGRGSQMLQLQAVIDKNEMLALLEGKLPNGQVLQNPQGQHRPGFDMTFSAPKSVSLLVGLDAAPDFVRFHDEAVKHALSHIESEFAEARVSRNGEIHYEKTGNLVIAMFRQPSSRANDPALHTHCVTMNMTFLDGVGKSLASDKQRVHGVVEQIQNNAHYCGLIYRQHLANSLKEVGFKLRLTGDGLFEIDGVPDELLHEFSKRRGAIETLMDDQGWVGAKLASKATLLTRQGKEEHDLATLKSDWKTRAESFGFDAKTWMMHREEPSPSHLFSTIKDRLRALFTSNNKNQEPSEQNAASACVQVAIETLSQRTSVFTERSLKAESLKHSLVHDKPIAQKAIDEAICHEKKEQTLYAAICPDTKQSILTTPWLLTLEAESITRIENNKGVLKPIASQKAVEIFQKAVDKKREQPMTNSQKEAMRLILTSKDRYLAIQGYAGVAKTTMLSEARRLIEAQGYQLRGLTVASSAANELQTKAGICADVFPVVHQELKKARPGSLHKMVFIVDEASMLSSAQGHELIKRVELTGARLVLVGDKAQLPSINSGRLFGLTQEYDIQMAVMDEIVRQKDPDALAAVKHATRGEVREAIQKLEHVEELVSHDERIQWIAKYWLSLPEKNRQETLLFAPTHANRREITEILRAGLEREGTLQGATYLQKTLKAKTMETIQQRFVAYYQRGDVIRFNQDFAQNKIKQGEYYTVGQVTNRHREENTLPLINDKGKTQIFPLKNMPQYKAHTAAFERVIEIYTTQTLALKVGDHLMWTRNFKACDLRNGQRAVLKAQDEKTLVFRLEGREITLKKDHPALKHLDYGYVLTNYKVQGKDAPRGVGLMESHQRFSATLKNFYVQISRGVWGMTLVTDDKEALARAIEINPDEKKASLDMISSHQLMRHEQRFLDRTSFSIHPVIDKKLTLERGIQEANFSKTNAIKKQYQAKELERTV